MQKKLRLAIDPGHPSFDGDEGATRGDFREVDFALDLAYRIDQACRFMLIEPILLRFDNSTLPISKRGEKTRELGCDFVLSVHCDKNPNKTLSGLSTYHRRGDTLSFEAGTAIAKAFDHSGTYVHPKTSRIHKRTERSMAATPNTWKGRALNVLNAHVCPALLVEYVVISNDFDFKLAQSEHAKNRMVAATLVGLSVVLEKWRGTGWPTKSG